jgi:hypothetical protein
MGLHGVNGSPVVNHQMRISADVQPSGKTFVNDCEEQPAEPRAQARYQPVRYWLHLGGTYWRERKAHRSTMVSDCYPALNQFSPERGADIFCLDSLPE